MIFSLGRLALGWLPSNLRSRQRELRGRGVGLEVDRAQGVDQDRDWVVAPVVGRAAARAAGVDRGLLRVPAREAKQALAADRVLVRDQEAVRVLAPALAVEAVQAVDQEAARTRRS